MPEKHVHTAPTLVAEILSASTRDNDLGYKRQLYAEQGVGTYLILNHESKAVEHLNLSEAKSSDARSYQATEAAETLQMSVCDDCMIKIHLSDLFE